MGKRIEIEIAGEAAGIRRAVNEAQGALGGLGSGLGRLAKTAVLAAGVAGIGALALGLHAGIKEYIQASTVAAQTNAVIKSTGGVANVSATQVDTLATALMRKSGVDDEVIKSGENVLLAFTHIHNEVGKGNDIFNRATAAVLDFSVRTGRDMPQAALALGKALEDPATKLTGLAKAGIIFTEAQKTMVKHMVETGHTMDAQKFILQELEKRYGGAAEAAGKTLPGQLKILREEFNNFAGDLVARAVPALLSFTGFLNDVAAAKGVTAKLTVVWEGVETAAKDGATNLWAHLTTALQGGPPTRVRVDLNQWVDVQDEGLIDKIKRRIEEKAPSIGPAMQNVVTAATAAWDRFGPNVSTILGAAFSSIRALASNQLAVLGNILGFGLNLISGNWGAAWGNIRNITGSILGTIGTLIRNQITIYFAAASAVAGAVVNAIQSGLGKLAGVVREKLGDAVGSIRGFVGTALGAGAAVGRALMEGIVGGIRALAGWVYDQAAAIVEGIKSRIKAVAGIKSPSEVFAQEIGHPLALGIIKGFERGLQHDTLLRPLMAAKKAVDDFVGGEGVANMTAQGVLFREALQAGFAGTGRSTPLLAGTPWMPTVPGPIMEPRTRSSSPDGAVVVNTTVPVVLDGKVIATVVRKELIRDSYTQAGGIFGGRAT